MKAIILEILGLVISVVALIVSCQANDLSKSNEARMLRLECIDKIASQIDEIKDPYEGMIITATQIHNWDTDQITQSNFHSKFQKFAAQSDSILKRIRILPKRFGLTCSPEFISKLSDVQTLANLTKNSSIDGLKSFDETMQNRHKDILDWLMGTDISNHCCTKQ